MTLRALHTVSFLKFRHKTSHFSRTQPQSLEMSKKEVPVSSFSIGKLGQEKQLSVPSNFEIQLGKFHLVSRLLWLKAPFSMYKVSPLKLTFLSSERQHFFAAEQFNPILYLQNWRGGGWLSNSSITVKKNELAHNKKIVQAQMLSLENCHKHLKRN